MFLLCFLSVFGSFWEVILGGFWSQVRFKTALETILFEKSEFSRKALTTNEQTIFSSPRGDPKRPKIAPRWPQDGLFWGFFFRFVFCIDFWSLFGAILVPFWRGLGSPNQHFWHRFFDDFCMSFQDRPKTAQQRPKTSQERPKTSQECPKRRPRGSKRRP